MWYLNIYTILSLGGLIILSAVLNKLLGSRFKEIRKIMLLLFNVGFILVFSRRLAVFYLVYAFANHLLFLLLFRTRAFKKTLFIISVLLNIGAFVLLRLFDEGVFSNYLFAPVIIIGFVYAMLKVINALYYAYYFDTRIPFINYLNYILFVPTFTSGPILKLKDFSSELDSSYEFDGGLAEGGIKRIIKGMFKKIVLVEVLSVVYSTLLAGELNFYKSAAALLSFYLLLFFDFSGYSDVAIGFGSLLGFKIPENFKKPFSSPTLVQFWRNWHATLGDWFRDHVFMLLLRRNNSRVYAGLVSFIIIILIGMWHEFNLLFLLWGVYHGILLFIENVFNLTTVIKRKVHPAYFWTRCAVTNLLVSFGMIFFSKDLETAGRILRGFLSL